jgi:putative transposase
MVTAAVRRAAVTATQQAHGISERRACRIIRADRSTVRYRLRRGDDAAARARLRSLPLNGAGSATAGYICC